MRLQRKWGTDRKWRLKSWIALTIVVYSDVTGGKFDFKKYVETVNGKILPGYQLRYVYFIDKKCRERLTVPEIPFSKIDEVGAGMYKGEKITQGERHIMR